MMTFAAHLVVAAKTIASDDWQLMLVDQLVVLRERLGVLVVRATDTADR
jgi:hypothetical protein